jgi:hypothetical protein
MAVGVDGSPCSKTSIVHCACTKHANVDALNRNPMNKYKAYVDLAMRYNIWKGMIRLFPNKVFPRTMNLLLIYSISSLVRNRTIVMINIAGEESSLFFRLKCSSKMRLTSHKLQRKVSKVIGI